jgi:hypothetical protein
MTKPKLSVAAIREACKPVGEQSEAEVSKVCRDWLTLNHFRWFRMNSGVIPMGSGPNKRMIRLCPPGTPDVLILLPIVARFTEPEPGATGIDVSGGAVWLEFKRPLGVKGGASGREQTDDQRQFQRDAEAAGERYVVIRSLDDLVAALHPVSCRDCAALPGRPHMPSCPRVRAGGVGK